MIKIFLLKLQKKEFAKNVLGHENATSTEFDKTTDYPIINLMEEQEDIVDLGGTMRLGTYPCKLEKNSRAYSLYNSELINERHRHRYEFNNKYRDEFENAGMKITGTSPDGKYVEVVELEGHPYFVASQYHPEFKSRPDKPHPLFFGWINAVLENSKKQI